MNTGVLFPTTEIGTDPIAIRDFAQAAESLGFDHMLFYDHVLGANEETPAGRGKPWRHTNMFHEPLVLFGYLAGVTRSIELATSILILPQRQTALVAKQAAAADVLSGGRLRLGIRVEMNPVEYEGMGAGFSDRGARTDEQIEVLRMLWTRELVTFEGRWHRITDAGINPMPVQRPIPLWIGGSADRVVRRLARLGDGWMFAGGGRVPDGDAMASLDRISSYAREAGRDPSAIGIQKVIGHEEGIPEKWVEGLAAWRDAGGTHIAFSTGGASLANPQEHIDAIRRFSETIRR